MHARAAFWVFISALLSAIALDAIAAGLYLWEPGPGYPKFVIPVTIGQSPQDAVKKYMESFNSVEGIETVRKGRKLHLPIGKLTPYSAAASNQRPKFTVLGNRMEHFFLKQFGGEMDLEMQMVSNQLKTAGADVYVVPVLADIALPENERLSFREKIAGSFDGMLALGGERDVHPSLYGEDIVYARKSSKAEDDFEIGVIGEFIKQEHGTFFGICKGHQLCSVSQGAKMVQDIPKQTTSELNHWDGEHRIRIDPDSLLAHILGRTDVYVNSYHHQAVIDRPGLPITPVATAVEPNGTHIVEAMELGSGLGITFQFHPEYMQTKVGRQIMTGMVRYSNAYRIYRSGKPASSRDCMKSILRTIYDNLKRKY